MRMIFLNIGRFLLLVLLQVFVINQMDLGFLNSYISIAIYISFILSFPVKASNYLLLLISFLLGLTIDLFMDTGGIHASACLTMAFLRPYLLRRLQTESPMDETTELTVYTEDLQKYVTYCLILVFCFFFWLFLLEEFSFSKIPLIILKTLISSVLSTILIILGQYLLFRKPKS
ncbi:MAG: rod shape-determining protein MreD [Flavobacteriales bacterium]